jgi:hypothetical protein
MADSTLNAIRTKVRRLTRTPSEAQLSTAELDQYINTFVLYDLPEHLRLFNLKQTFTFYTNPYQDVYENISDPAFSQNPLFDFKNRFISINPPAYIAGWQVLWTQSREQLFNIYPQTNAIASIGVIGDGVTNSFSGTLANVPVQANNVLFDSVGVNNEGLSVFDAPLFPSDGTGTLFDSNTNIAVGAINYVTGAYTFSFSAAPGVGRAINSQTIPYVPSLPQTICYFNDSFILRPIPDQPYRVDVEVYVQPTEMLDTTQHPELNQWWQLYALGAARKIFQDKLDMDSLSLIQQEFEDQMAMALRRTIVQNTNERVATIYTENTQGPNNNGFWWGTGNF